MALTEIKQLGLDDEAVNEGKIQISNAGTNGQYLQKQSGNTGGLTWADVPAGVGGATGVDFNDGVYSRWGDSNELRLHHDTNGHSYFQLESGKLFISANGGSDGVLITEKSTGDYMLWAKPAGGVNLYYDGSKKFETLSNGTKTTGNHYITGDLYAESEINMVTSTDSNKFLDVGIGTNAFAIRKTTGGDSGHENMIRAVGDGSVELYHNNNKKLETTSLGAKVTGDLQMGGTAGLKVSHTGTTSIAESQTAGDDVIFKTTPSGGSTTERLRVTSAGSLGVGTATPNKSSVNTAISVNGSSNSIVELCTGDARKGNIYTDGTDLYMTNNSTGWLGLFVNNNETALKANCNGSVELYYDNTLKCQTGAYGLLVGTSVSAPYSTRLLTVGDVTTADPCIEIRSSPTTTGRLYFNDADQSGEGTYQGELTFEHNGNNRMHTKIGGTTKISVTTDGLTFNGDTAAANALDDYEEGTYTPNFTSGSGSFTHGTVQGRYVKIGQLVYCTFRVDWTGGSPTGAMFVSAPFTTTNSNPFGLTGAGGVSYNGSFNDAYSLTIGVQGNNSASAGKFYARSDDDTTYDPNPAGTGRCDGWMMFYT